MRGASCVPQRQAHTRAAIHPSTPKALARLGKQLDPAGRAILAHLAENSHASIRQLADLIGAPSDMDVLFTIRQNINPTAQALLGDRYSSLWSHSSTR